MSPTPYNTVPQSASAAITSFAYDCGSGTNRVLRVWTSTITNNSGDGVTNVTYNGVGLTKVTGASQEVAFGGRFGDLQLWYLINPASGSNTLAFSFSSSGDVRSHGITVTTSGTDSENDNTRMIARSESTLDVSVPMLTYPRVVSSNTHG